jgi:hypothetical protein
LDKILSKIDNSLKIGHKFPPTRVGENLLQPLQKNDQNYEKKFEKNIFQPTYKNTRKNKEKKI